MANDKDFGLFPQWIVDEYVAELEAAEEADRIAEQMFGSRETR